MTTLQRALTWSTVGTCASTDDHRATASGHAAGVSLVNLRWIAAAVMLLTTVAAAGMGIVPDARPVLALILAIAVGNLFFQAALRTHRLADGGVVAQMTFDLVALTVLLHYTGGAANPLIVLYVVHAILAAILLPRRHAYLVAMGACLLFKGVVFGQLGGWLRHHPLRMSARAPDVTEILATDPTYAMTLAGLCLISMGTGVFFVSQVMEQLRSRDADVRRQRGRLLAAIESFQDQIVLFDRSGKPVAANRTGWIDADPSTLVRGDDAGPGPWPFRTAPRRDGLAATAQPRVREQRTGDRILRHRAFPVDREDTDIGTVWVVEDVTEQRQLEARARHQDRMATVGVMSAAVAHEIRNPLASISAIVQDLDSNGVASNVRHDLRLVASEVQRISRIVQDLNGYGVAERGHEEPLDAHEVIEEALSVIRHDPRARRTSIRHHADGPAPVTGCRDQLVQVFVNLTLNALDAMPPDGGVLEVEANAVGGNLRVAVRDNGRGIPATELAQIFEPFYTSKGRREGSGLGLAVCEDVLRRHGGRITVRSAVSRGSTFTVHLPLRQVPASAGGPPRRVAGRPL